MKKKMKICGQVLTTANQAILVVDRGASAREALQRSLSTIGGENW